MKRIAYDIKLILSPISDDLNVSPDFYEYFLGTHELLKNDSSLWFEYFYLFDKTEIISQLMLILGVCQLGTIMGKLGTLTRLLPAYYIGLISSQDSGGC